ncbi:hypothetical protein JOJ87_005094 [Rhodococcus ruber]|nr:hypothetical protein [Rhodococcus ruber]
MLIHQGHRPELFTKLLAADPSEEIAATWIAKELLRDLLACTASGGLRHEIRAALYRFYKFCAACSVPEVTALARTVETWQDPIVRAIDTGLSNARSEGYNLSSTPKKPPFCGKCAPGHAKESACERSPADSTTPVSPSKRGGRWHPSTVARLIDPHMRADSRRRSAAARAADRERERLARAGRVLGRVT